MLITFILYLVALYVSYDLGRHCCPPMIAGSVGLIIGQSTGDIRLAIMAGISLYVTCFMANTIPQISGYTVGNEVLATLGSLNEKNAACLYLFKGSMLLLFFLLRVPTPSFQMPWQITLSIATTLVIIASRHRVHWLDPLGYIVVQTILFSVCSSIAMNEGWVTNPVMGIICGLAIPRELDKTTRINNEEGSDNQFFYIPPVRLLLALFTVWVTPALSVSVISNTLFRRGAMRSVLHGGLEGCVEGYVLSLMARGFVSGQSRWGDLLQTPILNWGSFTPDYTVSISICISIGIGIVLPLLLTRFTSAPNPTYFKYFTVLFLTGQAITDVGYMLPLFLLVGYVLHKLRIHLGVDDEIASLGIFSTRSP